MAGAPGNPGTVVQAALVSPGYFETLGVSASDGALLPPGAPRGPAEVILSAAYGIVVAIFQWGWGASALGVDPGPINPFVPLMLFAIVFGLSMDYEVFLLSRIREEFDRTGDAVASVADGVASTARVITAAAAIMVVVFGSFLLEDIREVKLFGLGLAVAVLIDATLVRLVLVPATMALLGHRNWWMPQWLDRILPRVAVDGPVRAPAAVGRVA